MKNLKGYSKLISEATNVIDDALLCEIETIMREDIFCSTLDWMSKKAFNEGARKAYNMIEEESIMTDSF